MEVEEVVAKSPQHHQSATSPCRKTADSSTGCEAAVRSPSETGRDPQGAQAAASSGSPRESLLRRSPQVHTPPQSPKKLLNHGQEEDKY